MIGGRRGHWGGGGGLAAVGIRLAELHEAPCHLLCPRRELALHLLCLRVAVVQQARRQRPKHRSQTHQRALAYHGSHVRARR